MSRYVELNYTLDPAQVARLVEEASDGAWGNLHDEPVTVMPVPAGATIVSPSWDTSISSIVESVEAIVGDVVIPWRMVVVYPDLMGEHVQAGGLTGVDAR